MTCPVVSTLSPARAVDMALQARSGEAALQAAQSWKREIPSAVEASRYVLQIFWNQLEDHTVGFRQGPLFAQWRAIIGPFFAQPPMVEHFELVGKSD